MRRIQVDYPVDGTMCRDVLYTEQRVSATVHPDGRGMVKFAGHVSLYSRVVRIRITDVDEAGAELDMS
jgi:hypothetical protein